MTDQLGLDFKPKTKPASPAFDGQTYVASLDSKRLFRQLELVRKVMQDGCWRTLHELSQATGEPEASVSARLRDLRKPKHGGLTVQRRRRPGIDPKRGVFEYRLPLLEQPA